MTQGRRYWLMKSEPTRLFHRGSCAISKATTCWDGVRNYQARNFMRAMAVGDLVLFYHSSAEPPAVVGIAEVVRPAYPDKTQFDKPAITMTQPAFPLLHGGIWWTSGIVRRSRPVCRSTD